WGGASGYNPLDVNAVNPQNPGLACPLGVCTVASVVTTVNPSTVIQATGSPAWDQSPYGTNFWANYMIVKVGCVFGGPDKCFAPIVASTADTLSFHNAAPDSMGANLILNPGDQFQITKVQYGLDQVGRGGGSPLNCKTVGGVTLCTTFNNLTQT